jgi:hypothetical protein
MEANLSRGRAGLSRGVNAGVSEGLLDINLIRIALDSYLLGASVVFHLLNS